MDYNKLESNSHVSKAEKEKETQKRVTKPVVNDAIVRDKGIGKKLLQTFISGDITDIRANIIQNVLIPSVQDMLLTAVNEALSMLFGYSGSSSRGTRKNYSNASYTDYNKPSKSTRQTSNWHRKSTDIKDIIIPDRAKVERILSTLDAILEEYGYVTVADVYSSADISPNFTDNNYGWTDLSKFGTRRVREGWLLIIPRPEDIRD